MKVLISTLHDPDGVYGQLARSYLPEFQEVRSTLDGFVVAKTAVTSQETIDFLRNGCGATIVEGGQYGESRLAALREALTQNPDYIHCWDFDKFIHHVKIDKEELKGVFNLEPHEDFVVVGRPKEVFDQYPLSWRRYEVHINRLYDSIISIPNLDVCSGMFILSREAAQVVASQAQEGGVGSCGEWPLLAWKNGLRVGEIKTQGLTFEDPDVLEIQWGGRGPEFEGRVRERYTTAQEFAKRRGFESTMKAVAERFVQV